MKQRNFFTGFSPFHQLRIPHPGEGGGRGIINFLSKSILVGLEKLNACLMYTEASLIDAEQWFMNDVFDEDLK